jgi:hypothetical protein
MTDTLCCLISTKPPLTAIYSVYEKDDVELVVFQTTAGEMGVMSGHIPTVAALKTIYSVPFLKFTFTWPVFNAATVGICPLMTPISPAVV